MFEWLVDDLMDLTVDEHGAAKSVVFIGIAACSSSSSILCIG